MFKLSSAFLLLSSFAYVSCTAQPPVNKPKLDSLLNVLGDKNKAMLSIAVMRDGKQVYSKSIGYAQFGNGIKNAATAETRYRIGSISKVFTGTMIFQLIEEGKLTLATPLAKFFPTVTNAEKITIANLLNHSSGLFNFTLDPGYREKLATKITKAQQLAQFQHSPVFVPGSKHEYSNTNYVLLGFIIEELDKTTFADAVKKRITTKIDLKNTYYGGKISQDKNEAHSYKWTGSWVADTETDMSIPGGAGAMVSTPADLVKFFYALFTGKLVSLENVEQMKTIKDGYGMGLFLMPFYERNTYGHSGSIDGFQSHAVYVPEDKLILAITANGVNISLNDVGIGVLSILFYKDYKIPDYEVLTLKSSDLDKYLGTYSTDKMPLKISITKKDVVLYGQATGQGAFPLSAVKADVFTFDAAGITLTFDTSNSQMTLKQGAGTFVMDKEK
jgi:D-alanyl-D-alanine carboxypeptidase